MYDLFNQIADATRPTPPPVMNIPAQPEERQQAPATRIFTNIPDLITEVQKIGHADKMNFAQFQQLRHDIKEQTPAIMAMINKMTIAEINKFVYKQSSSDSKKDMTRRLYDSIYSSFSLSASISYSPFSGDTYEAARERAINAQTEELYIKYCEERQVKRDLLKKSLDNPETLEEFRIFLQYRKPDAMTTAQRIAYDELITVGKQERREKEKEYRAEVTAVKVEGLQMEIKTSHHAKKNIPLWVVVLSDRVEGEIFNDLKTKAHKFDGYYSSYRGQGAIPGFTFESEENAQLFCDLQKGNVNAYDIQQKTEAEILQERAQALADKAGSIEERANESLNRDRKDNTHRRAAMAANAERNVLYNLQFAQTMQKIAEGQAAGTVKFLNRLHNITDLDTLNGILSQAKTRHIQAKNLNRDEYEISMETVDYVKFPYPVIYVSNVMQDIAKLQNAPGCKMAAARMIKALSKAKEEFVPIVGRAALEDFEKLLCTHHRNIKTFYGNVEHHRENLMEYKRVIRMQLETLPELRTALRELITIKQGTTISPEMKKAQEIKELERKFIGVKIDGFFPTPGGTDPNGLARQTIDRAEILPGNTILEPSAGLGHLADVICELYPDNPLTVCEISYSLCEALRLKGYEVAEREDFLNHTGTYDRIIMNPPFENGQDMDHVRYAYSLLNEGGRLVAIMAANKEKTDSKTAAFNEFVALKGGAMISNPAGSFLSAFRPTGVSTITVVLDK